MDSYANDTVSIVQKKMLLICGTTEQTKMSQVTSPEIDGEVQTALPGLQGWVAARTLACTKPTDTQPTQLGHTTTGAGFTALVNAPETHLGSSV